MSECVAVELQLEASLGAVAPDHSHLLHHVMLAREVESLEVLAQCLLVFAPAETQVTFLLQLLEESLCII